MKTMRIILILILLVAIYNCKSVRNEEAPYNVSTDSTSNNFISSSAAIENKEDTARKFIRTADLKFKVKSVINSTYNIENITKRQGGFVTYTNLSSNIDNITTSAISADSVIETIYFTVTNTITLRVPNYKLDTTLKEIARNIHFLDYRIIKAEDVALNILSNSLIEKGYSESEERIRNEFKNKNIKQKETISAEELLSRKHEQADNAMISNLSLFDQIKFSTINLIIYQRQNIQREIIPNNKNTESYEPGFGSKIVEALKTGWNIFEAIFVNIVKLWAILLIIFISYFIYRKYRQRLK